MEIQNHSRSPSIPNYLGRLQLGRMMGMLWGSYVACGIPSSCAGPGRSGAAQPRLGYRNNEGHSVTQGPWRFFLLMFLSAVSLCFCWVWPLPQLLWVTFVPPWAQESISAFPSPSSSPLPWPQRNVCSSYPMIQPITSLTSNNSGFSCLVLFLLPYLFPSVTLIPSELNRLLLAATISRSFTFFHEFSTNFSQSVWPMCHTINPGRDSVFPFLFDPLPHLMSPVVTGAKHRVMGQTAPGSSQAVGGLQRLFSGAPWILSALSNDSSPHN